MNDTKKRKSGQSNKSRSANSSTTTSRESLHDSTPNSSLEELGTNGKNSKSLGSSSNDISLSSSVSTKLQRSSDGNGSSQKRKVLALHRSVDGLNTGQVSTPPNRNNTKTANSKNRHTTTQSEGSPPQITLSSQSIDSDGRGDNSKHLGQQQSGQSVKAHNKQANDGQSMSHDRVRKIVQEEGRSARNLIAYNVPAGDGIATKPGVSRPPPKSPRKRVVSAAGRDMSPTTKRADDSSSVKSGGSRPASSAGSQANRKTDMRARYWAFLFDNLKRAVDEIYQTCETDESVNECKEVIMILQQCTKDFQSLINQWNVIKTYEHYEESGQRPIALAWEVRKTSPGKLHLTSKDQNTPSPAELFTPEELSRSRLNVNSRTNSWADMVKGTMTVEELEAQHLKQLESPQPPTKEPPSDAVKPHVLKLHDIDQDLTEDIDGWETVRRSRSKTSPISKGSTSSKGSICSNGTGKFQKPNKAGYGDNPKNGTREQGKKPQAMTNKRQSTGRKKTNSVASQESNGSGSYRDAVIKASSEPNSASKSKDAVTSSSLKKSGAGGLTPDPKPLTSKRLNMNADGRQGNGIKSNGAPPSDNLLMVAKTNGGTPAGSKPAVNDPSAAVDVEDEEVLAMDLEQTLGQDDEALNEQDAVIESAIQEEQGYLLEIAETERQEMPVEIAQAFNNDEDDLEGANSGLDSMETSATAMDWDSLMARYEAEAERRKVLGLSWADIDEAESRTPGRGAHMHEKLSSPSRKRSIMESKKRHEERQAKAAELRGRFRQEKSEKVKDLTKKVDEVRSFKDKMEEQRREYIEKKLQEAEEKRQKQLNMRVRKAHEEENKANEIAFINTLSEQNKKMDILTKHEDVKARLMDIQEERQRKIGEKAAKEAAVEERRKALNAERSARLAEMQMKRKRREEEIEHEKFERDKERTEALKAKEKEHKDRLAEIERQQKANIEELQKKIEQKQSESARRHSERLQNIRDKAFIMNILKHSTEDQPDAPKLEPYTTKKMCTVCNIVIPSEVHLQSHLRGQQHQNMLNEKQTPTGCWSRDQIESFNIEHIQDVPGDFVDPKQASSRERSRSLKKRCKKLKQRMQARANEFEAGLDLRQETADSQHKAKLNKIIKDVNKFMQAQEKGPWPQNKISALDRTLGEAVRILDQKVLKDQIAFRICGGLNTFTKLLLLLHEENVIRLHPKTCSNVSQVIRLACRSCFENCHYFLFSNRTGVIVDLLATRLTWMAEETDTKADVLEFSLGNTNDSTTLASLMNQAAVDITIDVVASALVHTLAVILSCLSTSNPQSKASDKSAAQRPGLDVFNSRISDVISYVITVGIVDKLQSLYTNVRGSLDTDNQLFSFLQHSISFLTAITKLTASKRQKDIFDSPVTDSAELMQTYEDIELAGIMSLLYGILLHNVPTRGETSTPPKLSTNTLTVTLVGLKLVNQLATMDIKLVQRVLGAEGVSLELRHIISYLVWYCTHHCPDNDELLHEVILCIGYFVVLNNENQSIVQSGQSPTILQQLCSLPFQYFSNARLVLILYPCLIASCYQSDGNKRILEEELSCDLLANFLEESELQLQQRNLSGVVRKILPGFNQSDGRMSLTVRFPEKLWADAKKYFSSETSDKSTAQ